MFPSKEGGVDRRTFLKVAGAMAGAWPMSVLATPEILYNGIRLATPWPPARRGFQATPVPPPYLVDRPDVVPIDVGRQLFIDDFLIEETSLERTFHRPSYHPASPVLRPTTRWEKYDEYAERTKTRSNPAAMVFSDGVFYDPHDRLFKMWYMGGYTQNTCLALSQDGINWQKPTFDVVAGTNITMAQHRDSATVWLDLNERDRSRRFKMASYYDTYLMLYASPDGIHWRELGRSGPAGDRTTFFYNPFRKVWVFSIRDDVADYHIGRFRRYLETPDFEGGARWRMGQPVPWTAADAADPRRPENDVPPELYNLDCVAYESVLLGLFTIFRGEAERRLRWLQPRRLPLGSSGSARVPARLGARRRLELGQRAVGRGLLPCRRRPTPFLRQRPPRRSRQQRPRRLQHRSGHAAPRRLRVDGSSAVRLRRAAPRALS